MFVPLGSKWSDTSRKRTHYNLRQKNSAVIKTLNSYDCSSSIVYWGYQDNFKPIYYFFWWKDFACTKTRHMLEVYVCMKNCCLCCLVLAYFCFVCWFLLVTCFCAHETFSSKKKNKQAWNCLDNLNILYYWGVPLSSHLLRIYLHALIFICDHLRESLLFMRIFLKPFLFMIICENLFF